MRLFGFSLFFSWLILPKSINFIYFSKTPALHFIYILYYFVSTSFSSALILVIFFLLLGLGFICSYFSHQTFTNTLSHMQLFSLWKYQQSEQSHCVFLPSDVQIHLHLDLRSSFHRVIRAWISMLLSKMSLFLCI